MFILYGRRTVCINSDTDHQKVCDTCNSMGVDVSVYREYFHVFFLPIFPSGNKNAKINCSQCREQKWYKGAAEIYEQATRTPIYFYSGMLIIAVIILLIVIANIFGP